MEAFVQMSLETYDVLKSNNEYLKRKLKEEQEFSVSEFVELKNITVDEFKTVQKQMEELGWI